MPRFFAHDSVRDSEQAALLTCMGSVAIISYHSQKLKLPVNKASVCSTLVGKTVGIEHIIHAHYLRSVLEERCK